MVEECSDPNLTPRYRGAHHELSMTIKCQKCSESIQNCKCQKIGHSCMTCKNRGTLDKYGECTCCINCGKSQIGNSCDCCEICGEPKDFCLGCCNACKEVPCECTCFYCQQPNCICCEDCREYPCTCGQHNEQNEKEHDVSCQKCKLAQCDCGMTCQQSTTQRPCHPKPTTSATTRATTRAKEMITRPTEKSSEHKNIIKAFNLFLSTTRSEKEDLEWYIARFERNYAEVEKLGETLSPSLLSALLLRHAQLSKVDTQIISMNLELDPKATNATRNFESCKASMRRLQYNKTTSHLIPDNQSERFATSSINVEDSDDLDQEPKEPTGAFSGNAATRGGRRQRRRRGTKRKHAEDD